MGNILRPQRWAIEQVTAGAPLLSLRGVDRRTAFSLREDLALRLVGVSSPDGIYSTTDAEVAVFALAGLQFSLLEFFDWSPLVRAGAAVLITGVFDRERQAWDRLHGAGGNCLLAVELLQLVTSDTWEVVFARVHGKRAVYPVLV